VTVVPCVIDSFRILQTEERHIHIKFRFTFYKIAIGTLEVLKLPFRENILRTELCDRFSNSGV